MTQKIKINCGNSNNLRKACQRNFGKLTQTGISSSQLNEIAEELRDYIPPSS